MGETASGEQGDEQPPVGEPAVGDGRSHERPPGADDATVAAVGKASEAFEYIERVRGHLYELHQLMGRADFLFEDAADLLRSAGHPGHADTVDRTVVGRNLLDGRWTFQIVEEFDAVYYDPVRAVVRALEADLMAGRRHVFEAELKEQRRSVDVRDHESRPPAAYSDQVETRGETRGETEGEPDNSR